MKYVATVETEISLGLVLLVITHGNIRTTVVHDSPNGIQPQPCISSFLLDARASAVATRSARSAATDEASPASADRDSARGRRRKPARVSLTFSLSVVFGHFRVLSICTWICWANGKTFPFFCQRAQTFFFVKVEYVGEVILFSRCS